MEIVVYKKHYSGKSNVNHASVGEGKSLLEGIMLPFGEERRRKREGEEKEKRKREEKRREERRRE